MLQRNEKSKGFRPLSRWIGLYLYVGILKETGQFRFRPLSRWIGLYPFFQLQRNLKNVCFRPLSRWIGLYLKNERGLILNPEVSVPSRGG